MINTSFKTVKEILLHQITITPNVGLDSSESVISDVRGKVIRRLEWMSNSYHNKEHAIGVMKRMEVFMDHLKSEYEIDKWTKALLSEAALRHDDWHIWNTYRQNIDWSEWNISNEEKAVLLLMEDLKWMEINLRALEVLEQHILSTSFWQTKPALEKSFPGDEDLQTKLERNYWAKSMTEKLLAFADVSWLLWWMEVFMKENIDLLKETKTQIWLNDWLKTREWFITYYVKPLLESLKDFFDENYYNELLIKIDSILKDILNLSKPGADGEKYKEMYPFCD